MPSVLNFIIHSIPPERIIGPNLPWPERASSTATDPLAMTALRAALRGEKIVVFAAFENMRPLRDTGGGLSD